MNRKDYIVIGGGIIGMMTARELAIKGASVAIFERGKLGMEASWAAGGILSSMRPWLEHPASAELSEQGKIIYPDYVDLLKDETGIDSEYIRSGLLIIHEAHVDEMKSWARAANIKLTEHSYDISPGINLPEKSILLPEIAQLRPNHLIKALKESLRLLSVSIYENTEITSINIENNRFQNVVYEAGEVNAEAVIITAGVWSNSIVKNFNKNISIRPIHGQMICLKSKQCNSQTIILDGGHYLIPRLDGHVLIGSTMEDIGFVKQTTPAAQEELLDWAWSVWPDLRSAGFVRQWSGLRPSTERGKPYIGPVSGIENIYINAGHFRKGILQAPASANLLVDYLTGNPSFMDISSFATAEQEISPEIA